MLNKKIRSTLEKQGYRIVGKHSAVKICKWTKKSLRGGEGCWKEKFYGIKSLGCCQCTPSVIWCENKCLHCWMPIELNLGTKIKNIDEPEEIIEGIIKARKKLLMGFKSRKNLDLKKFREALTPKLFAFSLSGEPTLYPKLAELIKEVRKRNAISFLVTNGLNPEKIQEIEEKNGLPTQLVISVNAPNEGTYRKLCRSRKKDAWKKLNASLDLMKNLKCRTVVRLTLIKNLNMKKEHAKGYAELIKKANPLFVHVKGYAALGLSKKRLGEEEMPSHEEIKAFAKQMLKFLPNYQFLDDRPDSFVALLGKDKERMRIKEG